MADFLEAHKLVIVDEGLYSDDKEDAGGETVLGLTRNMDADWEGWKLVDERKKMPNFPNNLKEIRPQIDALSQPYYKKKYWNPMKGDSIIKQIVANPIYNSCVNIGVTQGIKLAQRAAKIPETGKMDAKTLNALNNKV